MIQFKSGKTPARKNAVKLKFSKYSFVSKLPQPADINNFGHASLLKGKDIGMLGNDTAGDCVWAGADHETMLFTQLGGTPATFNATSALSDYSAVTGFKANDPGTDRGTDMQAAASYRKNTGIIDAAGNRHKVAAYLALETGNFQELLQAMFLFEAVGIGIAFTQEAMDQFNAGEKWDYISGAKVIGGHYVPIIGREGDLDAVTWGQIQLMTQSFYENQNDESIVYLSPEIFKNQISPEGFDWNQLQYDLLNLS